MAGYWGEPSLPYRVRSAPEPVSQPRLSRRCGRGERCPGAQADDDGVMVPAFAEEGPFCLRDYRHVARCLDELPEKYVELRSQLGSKTPQGDDRVSGSRTPPVPVRLDYDELIRDMLLILCSWEEALRAAAQLTPLDTVMSRRRRDEIALPAAVTLLAAHFDRLLVLPSAPMRRIRSMRSAAELPEGTLGLVHPVGGYAEVILELDGAQAGLEILGLHYRARSALRQTNPPPEKLDGIPCKKCDMLSLERAAPPRSPEGTEYWSECGQCGHLMSRIEYLAWVKLYAAWAEERQAVPMLEAS
jgi:hypothetical protein